MHVILDHLEVQDEAEIQKIIDSLQSHEEEEGGSVISDESDSELMQVPPGLGMISGSDCYFGTWEPLEIEEVVVKKEDVRDDKAEEYLSYVEFVESLGANSVTRRYRRR